MADSASTHGFTLPAAPGGQSGPVKAWAEEVAIPTYHPMAPDPNPMFLENRVYQGSSGRVYPLPFIDRIETEAREHRWQAIHIENEFVRVMVLPELGGRIHVGLDKTNGYDFFYRQNTIKPALVGLAGPWISGGVEFNWPQHHRPATFMPVEWRIEEGADGSRTVWLSDHDPVSRMKGMHGVCLHPGRAAIELKVRLYNRTASTQTFLWWANAGVRVHEQYQSFFPDDVDYVADHARRAMSRFPFCEGRYYGVDYAGRAQHGVAEEERPRRFVPDGTYPANDLRWYANIPVPTSYMILGSSQDFFGGYDHRATAGVVHVADHHIAPGKKQWTWGNQEFGYAWDRNLSDDGGPYIELMAGVYTDNQPDFSFLGPYETRRFSQAWYPIQKIGPARQANLDAALALGLSKGAARIGVCVTRAMANAAVRLECAGDVVWSVVRDLAPGAPLTAEVALPGGADESRLCLTVVEGDGSEVIRWQGMGARERAVPEPATEPALPGKIRSVEELFLTGQHLAQYRHTTRHPEEYWREALRRDPGDSRCNNALGKWHLERGEFDAAEDCFRRAIVRLTRRNPNPADGEAFYNLGMVLRRQGRDEEAYAAFYKAAWNQGWCAAAYHALAELDAKRGRWRECLEHLGHALRYNADHLAARGLRIVALGRTSDGEAARDALEELLRLDPLDAWGRELNGSLAGCDNQTRLDLAFDCARAGLIDEACGVLQAAAFDARDGSAPMVLYTLAWLHRERGETEAAEAWARRAAAAPPDYCFPSRLEELRILEDAVGRDPGDARAEYYLGNLLYDRRRYGEAIECWERSAARDAGFAVVWRNLGIGYFNVLGEPAKALDAFERAVAAGPSDARLVYERDQLWRRTGKAPADRLAELEKRLELVSLRDDLTVELATLYNQSGQPERAMAVLLGRRFQPWEGGEGLALGQYVRAKLALGRRALAESRGGEGRQLFAEALAPPENLGEAWHPLANRSEVCYWLGLACRREGDGGEAKRWFGRAAASHGDFQKMAVQPFSGMTYYSTLALKELGRHKQAERLLGRLSRYAEKLGRGEATVDYFATSLPAMLLFHEDAGRGVWIHATYLRAQAALGLGDGERGRALLAEVLKTDPNHAGAADLLAQVDGGA